MNPYLYLILPLVAFVVFATYAARIAWGTLGVWRSSIRLNSTEDWIELPRDGQEPAPLATPLNDWFRGVITRHLEADETLEGFANAFFSPPRPRDWGIKLGLDRMPVLVAATSRRILLFELGYRTVRRTCFFEYRAIRLLIPPKPRLLGTSGTLRLGLESGREYQLGLSGPLASEEGMRQERRLAAHLRSIAPQFAAAVASDSQAA